MDAVHSERRKQTDQNTGNTFTKGDRLLKRIDFLRLRQTGERFQNRHFIAYVSKNNLNGCRLGITVTRKVGKAFTRNRIKRLAREHFRQNRQNVMGHWDISLIAKKQCANVNNKTITASLDHIFVRIALHKTD